MRVDVVNLKRHYGPTRAVDGISFAFDAGQIVGFVGPNGAGKTTTMRIIATMDEPTSGDVLLDNTSVTQYPERARGQVGFVPDTLPDHHDMTVWEYLDFYARAYALKGERRSLMLRSVEEFASLGSLREKMIDALSKGMQQRVSLARALLHDPQILVLDEPAAGLDPRARVELRELLRALAEQGKAILISSHILAELAEMCHAAVIIERGKLLRAAPIPELLASQETRRRISIRCTGSQGQLQRALLQIPVVEDAHPVGAEVEAVVTGGDESCADVLAHLLRAGIRVVELRQQRADLEDVFMSVTRGDVQ